jgi:hypothetical protein
MSRKIASIAVCLTFFLAAGFSLIRMSAALAAPLNDLDTASQSQGLHLAPAPAPVRAAAPTPPAGAAELKVDAINVHYGCQRTTLEYEIAPGVSRLYDGYRSFQMDAYVTNQSDKPVEILLKPARWIITDGTTDTISDLTWEWTKVFRGYTYFGRGRVAIIVNEIHEWHEEGKHVTLQPGQWVGWTFLAFPLDKDEWVKGVDFVLNNRVYHTDFDLGPYGQAYDYGKDCGIWVPRNPIEPTPTPGPAAVALGSVPIATPARPAAGQELRVAFINPRYNCENGAWEYESVPGVTQHLFGYRSFWADMYITVPGDKSVQPPWVPRRWIITDGQQDMINDLVWIWKEKDRKIKLFQQVGIEQPAIQPGQTAGWTFVAFPLQPNQWVRGVDFEWNGKTYHQDFDIGPYVSGYGSANSCGVPVPNPVTDPTPTPGPAAVALGAAPTATPARPAAGQELRVGFINPHYNCENGIWEYEPVPGLTQQLFGYRSFQADMNVTVLGDETVQPPWVPRRWIITDGKQDMINDLMWIWRDQKIKLLQQVGIEQPAVQPGQTASWTFAAFPLQPNQWVKGVDFEWHGQTYHQDFDIGPYLNDYGGATDCGIPKPNPVTDPTPTPRP